MLPPPSNPEIELRGLSPQQKATCRAALEAFLDRHGLDHWGLIVQLSETGPRSWELDISVVGPNDLDVSVWTSHLFVDKTLDLERVVDLCLETHYHASMNRKAAAQGS
jgi:hypothetical protein